MFTADSILSALFVMLVVFVVLLILYLVIRVFTAIVKAVEANFLSDDDVNKKGGA